MPSKPRAAWPRAHDKGIVHRDLKPENTYCSAGGCSHVACSHLQVHWNLLRQKWEPRSGRFGCGQLVELLPIQHCHLLPILFRVFTLSRGVCGLSGLSADNLKVHTILCDHVVNVFQLNLRTSKLKICHFKPHRSLLWTVRLCSKR
jgi:serine/threonine protein kinase